MQLYFLFVKLYCSALVSRYRKDLSDEIIEKVYHPLYIICYTIGSFSIFAGLIYLPLITCPAGSDMFIMGVKMEVYTKLCGVDW